MEVVEAVSEVWGPDRVGVRLSPLGDLNDINDAEPETTFGAIAQALNDFRFAYQHIVNPAAAAIEKGEAPDARAQRMLALIRKKYRETLIIAGGFDRGTAEAWLEQGKADLIWFGRKFLIPIIRRWRRNGASNRKPAWTIDGDSTQRPPFGLRILLPVELPEKYGRSAATGIASAQNLTHLKHR